jgi:hypothetical protein
MSSSRTNPRAEASRCNGARSCGPVTAKGRARSARNALKQGLRASTISVLGNEDQAERRRLAAALRAELAPEGELQEHLADQTALAIWRARRSERIETRARHLLSREGPAWPRGAGLRLLVIRDRNGARALDTLLRYRGSVQTELFRALAALKALQAEAAASAPVACLPPEADSTERTQNPL